MLGDEPKSKLFFKFDKFALILGFVVDTITIISILFAIRLPEFSGIRIPAFITPSLALGIWILFAYLYLAYLHEKWEHSHIEQKYHERFLVFVLYDLIYRFRQPFELLPGIVLTVLLIFIFSDPYFGLFRFVFLGAVVIGLIVVLLNWKDMSMINSRLSDTESKRRINDHWDDFSAKICIELERHYWISVKDLRELQMFWHLSEKAVRDALIRYAHENPTTMKYGDIYRAGDFTPLTIYEGPVLVDYERLPKDKYSFHQK